MNIVADNNISGTYRSGGLHGMTAARITATLGFAPNVVDDPDKVVHSWSALVDGERIAIWDYKGSHRYGEFSTFGPHDVFVKLFGDKFVG